MLNCIGGEKKNPSPNAEDTGDGGSIPGSGRSTGVVATHSSILVMGSPMDSRAWWVTVHGLAKSQTRLSN